MYFWVESLIADGPGVHFDMRFNEVLADKSEFELIEQFKELFWDKVIRGEGLNDPDELLLVDGDVGQRVIVEISCKKGLHQIEVPAFAGDCVINLFDPDYPVHHYSQNQVFAFIILNAVELEGLARHIDVLHVYFGCHNQGVP